MTQDDGQIIREILLDAFPTAMEANLVELLSRNDNISISLIAEVTGQPAGFIAFSSVTIRDKPDITRGLGLAPVAVKQQFQNKGIGSQLIRDGLEQAKQEGHEFVVVLGDPKYYHRFGFQPSSNYGLNNEYGVDEEFMALELTENALAGNGGLVLYAKEFAVAE
jgi:putative acetyltransferase